MGDVEVNLDYQLAMLGFCTVIAYLVGDLRTLGRLSGLGKEEESDREDEKARDDKSLERGHDAGLQQPQIN